MNLRKIFGFSLHEVLIAVIIIGVLASLAFINYSVVVEKSHAKEGESLLMAMYGAQKRYAVEHNGTYATLLSQLDVSIPSSQYFQAPVLVSFMAQPHFAMTRHSSYTLEISSGGVVTCSGGPAGLCGKMGYNLTPAPAIFP